MPELKMIIPAGIKQLRLAESMVGCKLVDQISQARGETIHGVGHTARVIFWTGCLEELSNQAGWLIPKEDGQAALYAAFFHDLARIHDGWDEDHGWRATELFEDHLRSRLPGEIYERCRQAITWHSRSHRLPKDDPIAMLLKDADALDRGRLNPPGKWEGVKIEWLNLPVLRSDRTLADSIAWAAYRLAQNTLYRAWGQDPCGELAKAIEPVAEQIFFQ